MTAALARALLVFAVALSLGWPARSTALSIIDPEPMKRAENARTLPVYTQLRKSPSPRDWALASQLRFYKVGWQRPPSGAQRDALLRKAAAAAPDDALVQWLALNSSLSQRPADAAKRFIALPDVLRLEPENGLALAGVVDKAAAAGDAAAVDKALAGIAAAPRFDNHIGEFVHALMDVAQRYPGILRGSGIYADADRDAYTWAMEFSGRVQVSSETLLQQCERTQPQVTAQRLALCSEAGRNMARKADSYGVRSLGLELISSAGEPGPADVELERELVWLADLRELWKDERWDEASQADQAELLSSGNWFAARRAMFAVLGRPVLPPAGWQPSPSTNSLSDDDIYVLQQAFGEYR